MSGDIFAGEAPPGEPGWRIDLPAPVQLAVSGETARAIWLVNGAVSTSGDAQQFIEIGGVRYSHVVDPRSGLGVTSRVMCTVVSDRGELADAAASAICVLGDDGAPSLQRRFESIGVVVWKADRRVTVVQNPGGRIRFAER